MPIKQVITITHIEQIQNAFNELVSAQEKKSFRSTKRSAIH